MKVNENGTLLKVKCLILLNIFSVFLTHVGMFLQVLVLEMYNLCLPNACGDVPVRLAIITGGCLPHACGDVPHHMTIPE